MTDPDALTTEQAAERMGVSDRTVRTLIAQGELASLKIRGARRVRPADIAAYLARQVEAEQDRHSGYQQMAERKMRRIS